MAERVVGSRGSGGRRLRGLRALVACAFSAAALTTLAFAPAHASGGALVSFRDCLVNGGTTSVPSGVPITVGGIGFAEGSYGLIENFLLKEHTTLTISDATTTTYDLSRAWGAPQRLDRNLWVTRLPDTSTAVTLAPGESLVATYDITTSQPLLVAFPPVGPTGDNGPFLVTEEGPISCQVTAG